MRRIRFLVDRGAWVKGSGSVKAAAELGRLDAAEFLIENGGEVDDPGDQPSGKKTSALLAAAENGHEGIVRLLVQFGANVGLRDDSGRSAADLAQGNGHSRLANLLRPA